MGALSPTHLIILLVIVVVIFGTKKFRSVGNDLGAAVKGFKDGMKDDEAAAKAKAELEKKGQTIDAAKLKDTQ